MHFALSRFVRWQNNVLSTLLVLLVFLTIGLPRTFATGARCRGEIDLDANYVGVRFKALLVDNDLSKTGVLLFNSCGFTKRGEHQPHFFHMMIKAINSRQFTDGLCLGSGKHAQKKIKDFGFMFALQNFEDKKRQINDIAAWTHDPRLFPRLCANIDSYLPEAADEVVAEYQVKTGGSLKGREIHVQLERAGTTRLGNDRVYFYDPDLPGDRHGSPAKMADIEYRKWVATFRVPSRKIDATIDFYLNAEQGEFIRGRHLIDFAWEDFRRPAVTTDHFKVLFFAIEAKTVAGVWVPIRKFRVDYYGPNIEDHAVDKQGRLLAGYRRTTHENQSAIEASFGYGHSDYGIDGDVTKHEWGKPTVGWLDLTPTPDEMKARAAARPLPTPTPQLGPHDPRNP
jgi:hypothetical protein